MCAAPRRRKVYLRCGINGLEAAREVLRNDCHAVTGLLDAQGTAEAYDTGTVVRD